jgi:hypothetical protein
VSAISAPARGLSTHLLQVHCKTGIGNFSVHPPNSPSCGSFLPKSKLAVVGYDWFDATEPVTLRMHARSRAIETASEFAGGAHNGGSNARKTLKFFDPGPVQFPTARFIRPPVRA